MLLSAEKAAKIAGVSRSSISKAVNSGQLPPQRNNLQHIRIDEDDLQAWMERRPKRKVTPKADPDPAAPSEELIELQINLATAEKEVDLLKQQLGDKDEAISQLRADRDAEIDRLKAGQAAEIDRLSAAHKDELERQAKLLRPAPGFLSRLFGR